MIDSLQVKQVISELLYPQASAGLMLLAGVIVCLRHRRSTIGRVLIVIGPLWLLVASLPITGYVFYRSLECRVPPDTRVLELRENDIRKVVVLGNVVEGVRLWKRTPGAVLVISSGALGPEMADRARAMGVPRHAIVLETEARDTIEQASVLKPLLDREPFALSTWAVHMPRTLAVFRSFGLDPVPVPTDYARPPRSVRAALTPSRNGLFMTRIAIHEYVGTLWLMLRPPFVGT
jgi:uncharacterized SAM-binding protein YcdF (DUF218 family)